MDGNYSTVSFPSNGLSAGLDTWDFGFTIPDGATDLHLYVDLVEHATGQDVLSGFFIDAVDNGTTIINFDDSPHENIPSSPDRALQYDLGTVGLTITGVNASTFRILVTVQNDLPMDYSVDAIYPTITYTDPVTGQARRVVGNGRSLVKMPKGGIHIISDLKKPN